MLNIILDLIVIATLSVTVVFAFILNQRLTIMYKSKAELQSFIEQFSLSLRHADTNIRDLKGMGESVFKTSQAQMDKATILKDDLKFLLERGEEVAQKLEDGIKLARSQSTDHYAVNQHTVNQHTVNPQPTLEPQPTNVAQFVPLNTLRATESSDTLLQRLKNVR